MFALLMMLSLCIQGEPLDGGTAGAEPGGTPCPDQVVEAHEMEIRALREQVCSGKFSFTFKGVTVETPPNSCPLLVVITPAYDGTKHVAGSNTFTQPIRTLQSKVVYFECRERWVFGIIPIVVSTNCERTGESVAGAFTHYAQYPCTTDPR